MVETVTKEYRKASKKEKGAILDRFVEATDYQRRYGPDCCGIKVDACRWEEPWWWKGTWQSSASSSESGLRRQIPLEALFS